MFRLVSNKYLKNLLNENDNLRTELVAIYGEKGYKKAQPCQLCLKRPGLTEHHLVPKKQRGKAAQKLMDTGVSFNKAIIEIRLRKIKICRHCHNLLHENYTDEELAQRGSTFEDVVCLYRLVAEREG